MGLDWHQIGWIATVGTLATLWAIEAVTPHRSVHAPMAHDINNLIMSLINGLVVWLVFTGVIGLMVSVSAWAEAQGFGLAHFVGGPDWLRWVLVLVLFDLWMYVWHVMNHKVPWLWRFHAVHHSDSMLDVSSGIRFHVGEVVFSSLARMLIVPLIGMNLIQLLVYEMILRPIVLFHHSNIRVPAGLDRCLRWLIVTPGMHWVHHSRFKPETDSNYASGLSLWDRLFGTLRTRSDPSRIRLGLDGYDEPESTRVLGMLGSPLRRRPSDAD